MGLGARQRNAVCIPQYRIHNVTSSMEKMVIMNPMQLISVKADPTYPAGANRVLKEENWGESATTESPHSKSTPEARASGRYSRAGEIRQQKADIIRAPSQGVGIPRGGDFHAYRVDACQRYAA